MTTAGLHGHFLERGAAIMRRQIQALDLRLDGRTVLTEVGSHGYLFTPLIPLLAGAESVRAWAADSAHGNALLISRECRDLARSMGVSDRLSIRVNERPPEDVRDADIITNSGAVRPLDEAMLKQANGTPVIPLMYEAWELRTTDIDIEYCRRRGIPVAGTWEGHPELQVFDYVGPLALKLAFEAGYEVFQNNIAIWSDDEFGRVAATAFRGSGAKTVTCTTDARVLRSMLASVDFVFFCSYHESRELVGEHGILTYADISTMNRTVGIVHLYGSISFAEAESRGVFVHPRTQGRTGFMSRTLAHVGLEPLLRLQVAGFKVAEELLTGNLTELSQRLA